MGPYDSNIRHLIQSYRYSIISGDIRWLTRAQTAEYFHVEIFNLWTNIPLFGEPYPEKTLPRDIRRARHNEGEGPAPVALVFWKE